MWRKLLSLLVRKPELLLNHLEAYGIQATQELREARGRYLRAFAGLVLSGLIFALSLVLLAFASILDLGLVLQNREWVYGIPAALLLLSGLAFYYFKCRFKKQPPSLLTEQLRADFALIKVAARKA